MKLETLGPTNYDQFRLFVMNPALAECQICSICAIVSGANGWVADRDPKEFLQGLCPGCGRNTYISAIKNFAWSEQ
jgi:hypothetical protein